MPQRAATIESLPAAFRGGEGHASGWAGVGRGLSSAWPASPGRDHRGRDGGGGRSLAGEPRSRETTADRRNGYYRRSLLTELGDIELFVPRTRRYCPTEVVRAYARRSPEIDRTILAGFVLGLSTRKLGEVLLCLLGRPVSPTTVSRVAQSLDAAVAAFHARPLKGRYKALMLDGVVLARKTGAGALRRPVLVALGLRP